MSWSVNFIGKADNVVKALTTQSEKFSDYSKVEYDSALPHLVGIVSENFGEDVVLQIIAGGYGYAKDGVHVNRNLTV